MRVCRLYLRNYRVYEEPLDLELPPGLVGIYGPNGSGKSTLLEGLAWSLWGVARTAKDEIRTSGVNAECVAEVEFEHEGHVYLVRRSLSGAAATARAEAWCDNSQVTEGVRDTGRYVHSVLGMDDDAFRASVFAEQKQLAAFSSLAPAKRRDLVLGLLGISPLDAARDQARRDARSRREDVERLRDVLSDLGALEEEVAALRGAAHEAAGVVAGADEAVRAALAEVESAEAEQARLSELGREWDRLVEDGRRAREELERLGRRLPELEEEDRRLAGDEERLEALEAEAAGLEDAEARLRLLDAVLAAGLHLEEVAAGVPLEPPPASVVPAEAAAAAAEAAETASREAATLGGRRAGALAECERAARAVKQAEELSGEGACPLCGQELGSAFEAVREHRAEEVAAAEAELEALTARLEQARCAERAAVELARAARVELEAARAAEAEHARLSALRAEAAQALESASAQAVAAGVLRPGDRPGPGERESAAAALRRAREAAEAAATARGRLERRASLRRELDDVRDRSGELDRQVGELREQVRALPYRPESLKAAQDALGAARQGLSVAQRAREAAAVSEAEIRGRLKGGERRLEEGRLQHARLDEISEEARHLGRTADLLGAFRNAVVGAVGPRLSAQAAELFGELTDHEYDQLEVDPETYEIRIRDQGSSYGMSRFSGSETDLANLALRVAISEQVRFQSGGVVGLLVLDEVFGPLDQDRKERMLLALERLRGRFRQVLVVTHDSDVKEQLPNAVEVIKLPGRRARARLL